MSNLANVTIDPTLAAQAADLRAVAAAAYAGLDSGYEADAITLKVMNSGRFSLTVYFGHDEFLVDPFIVERLAEDFADAVAQQFPDTYLAFFASNCKVPEVVA